MSKPSVKKTLYYDFYEATHYISVKYNIEQKRIEEFRDWCIDYHMLSNGKPINIWFDEDDSGFVDITSKLETEFGEEIGEPFSNYVTLVDSW